MLSSIGKVTLYRILMYVLLNKKEKKNILMCVQLGYWFSRIMQVFDCQIEPEMFAIEMFDI